MNVKDILFRQTGVCLAFALMLAALAAWGCSTSNQTGKTTPSASPNVTAAVTPYAPTITPAAFSEKITNEYFPLTPGTVTVFEGTKGGKPERVEVTVTHDIKTILGVRCIVVHDVVTVNGEVHEDTYDWYAQDSAGNVWYFGEDSKEYANGEVISTKGSWQAGVAGAQPGIIMEAQPREGDAYRQEYYEGEAEDMAKVLNVSDSVDVPYGSFKDVLVTEDTTPLEPATAEHKYSARGIGVVLVRQVRGGTDQIRLVSVTMP